MIDIVNVTKRFGKFTALSGMNLSVGCSSIYGLVGYNGVGKTTLLKTVSGVYKPEEGEVRIGGENIFDNAKMKQRLFYVPDDLYFQPYASMEKMARFYKGYYPKFSDKTFQNLTKVFGLDSSKRINGFSKGMQRQAEFVLGMSAHPDVLLLDESFDGLDPAKRSLSKQLLVEYMAEKEVSIIVSSHNLHEIEGLCDHVGLINGQKLALDCSIQEISQNRCKFRLAFNREMTQQDFAGLEIKRFKKDGSMILLTTAGERAPIEEKLRQMKPLVLESMPLSLEEIFLDEMEGTDYDFTEIFN